MGLLGFGKLMFLRVVNGLNFVVCGVVKVNDGKGFVDVINVDDIIL